MDLSVEMFEQASRSLAGPVDDTTRDSRRQPRAGIDAQATIIPLCELGHSGTLSVRVRDLSASGLGFLHVRKMGLDEQFALLLGREGDSPAVLLCCVAFWQPVARNVFAIGARFIRVLRDGGDPPLAVDLSAPPEEIAAEIRRLHRKAS
ncbi:MAG TPA: hypothetical protein VFC78_13145 [Tepidisphaeraceae bacterium]|nr:hypothetical protein [Tepidisphaeraceae bacterium]